MLSLILFVVALVYSNEYFFTCVSNDAIPFLHSYVSSYLAHVSLSHTQNTLLLKFESLPLCCWFLNNSFLRGKSDLGAERYVEVRERVSVCVCVCIKAGKREEGGEWVGG